MATGKWSQPVRYRVDTVFQNPGTKFKEKGTVKELVIDNRGPGTVYFSPFADVGQFTGQRLNVGERWIEDTCPHDDELFVTADTANTDIVVQVKV